ncbi:phosphoenolpyruvate carboxylase, partial [Mesorhizobium sp. M2D.F.Ca.ET.140.01.1.1]
GGDRDGNPNVTARTTAFALSENRKAAVEWHIRQLRRMVTVLSVSANVVDIPDSFQQALERALAASGAAAEIPARNPNE